MRSLAVLTIVALAAAFSPSPALGQDAYRFGAPKDSRETYADGTVVPHREQAIERRRADGTWENVGHVEIHLHNVKRDATDVEDLSAGVTVRVNPKKGE